MNRAAILLWGDRRGTNSLWSMFATPSSSSIHPDRAERDRHARRLVARFRLEAGRAADREPFDVLVTELSEVSPEFQRLWLEYDVAAEPEGVKTVRHPEAGTIELEHIALVHREPDGRTLHVTIYTPMPGESRERAARLFTRD